MKPNTRKRQVTQGAEKNRKTGIDIIGDVPWGTHFCQFYQTKQDLIDILVPYFKAGLENNEFCMWVTSEPLEIEDAKTALRRQVKNLDNYIKKGQIEILDYSEWYTKSGKFHADKVLQGWVEKEKQALIRGFDGLRLTSNTFWLEKKEWRDFADYEEEVNNVIGKYRMIAICTYSLDKCGASEVIDVISNHQFALIKREGEWSLIESSERKRAEEALRESEEKYRDLIENINDLVYTLDSEGNVTSANKATFEDLEYTSDDLYKKNFKDLIPQKYQAQALRDFRTVLERGEIRNATTVLTSKTGKEIWVEFNSTAIVKDGKVVGTRGIVRDITERKRAEEELRESEEKFRSLVETTSDWVWAVDPNGIYTYASPKVKDLLGYEPEEVIGKTPFDLMPPDEAERVTGLFRNAVESRKSFERLENTNLHKDGRQVVLETSGVPILDAGGNFLGYRGIDRDITERKRAEEALRQTRDYLTI